MRRCGQHKTLALHPWWRVQGWHSLPWVPWSFSSTITRKGTNISTVRRNKKKSTSEKTNYDLYSANIATATIINLHSANYANDIPSSIRSTYFHKSTSITPHHASPTIIIVTVIIPKAIYITIAKIRIATKTHQSLIYRTS